MSELFIENKKIDSNTELWEVYLHSTKVTIFMGSDGKRNAKLFVKVFSEFYDIPNYLIKE